MADWAIFVLYNDASESEIPILRAKRISNIGHFVSL